MLNKLFFSLLLCAFPLSLFAQNDSAKRDLQNPDQAQLVTTDVELFWSIYDRFLQEPDPKRQADLLQREYLDKGTVGLKDLVRYRGFKAENMVQMLRAKPTYFARLRQITPKLKQVAESVRRANRRLHELYPEASFPDVYFAITAFTGGGTASNNGLLIGTELFGRTADLPLNELSDWERTNVMTLDDLAPLIAHELIHFQQKNKVAVTLGARSIKEGAADFVSELLGSGTMSRTLETRHWADARERELWEEFQREMESVKAQEYGHWFSKAKEGRPYDLGYYMGYKICQSYYGRAADKRQALKDILEIRDYKSFFAASQYAGKFAAKP